tara:strand:+ start:230 stop:1210 length:981 start_codon:yes stop_codon:yes gene_type:complete
MEYSDWRAELSESQECQCEGCDTDPCVECGENCHDVSEAKIDDVKYGKGKGWNQPDKKRIDIYHARHSYLKKNPPNVRSDRNKRFNAQNVVFYGHDKVEDDRKRQHHKSRNVPTRGIKKERIKKEISGKDTSIDLKKEEVVFERLGGKGYKSYTSLTGKKVSGDWENSDRGGGHKWQKRVGKPVEKKSPTYIAHVINKPPKKEVSGKDTNVDLKTEGLLNFIQTGVRRHNKSINQKKIDAGKAIPYGNMLVNKGKEEVDPKKNPVVASHKLEGKLVEEVQGGVSFETYTKGIQFHEVETVDIIKPEPLKPSLKAAEYSDWRVELDK